MFTLSRLAATLTAIALVAASHALAAPLKVVASMSIIGDLAQNVGGDSIELTTLVGPDGDAHVYEPKPADAAAMAGADVVLVNGLHLEGFLQRLVTASATGAAIVELTRGVTPLTMSGQARGPETGGGEGDIDPHAFQSVANARIYVGNIADAFCDADAGGCDGYRARAAAYAEKLVALDAEIRAAVAAIAPDKRIVITSHDAFGYFAHEYGLTFLAPEGISTESEASAADVAALITQIRQDGASAIFVESITDRRLVERIADETGLSVGGTLYSDALSGPDGPAASYIGLMRHNIDVIGLAIAGAER